MTTELEVTQDSSGDDVVVVKLMKSYTAHGKDIEELTIHEPGPREYEAMDRGGEGQIKKANHLLAAAARVPYGTIISLKPKDYQACMNALNLMGPTDEEEVDLNG